MVKLRQWSFVPLMRRTALVTGASRGVGKGIAVILAKRVSRFSARAGRLAMRICRIALFGFPATTPATMKLPPCLQKLQRRRRPRPACQFGVGRLRKNDREQHLHMDFAVLGTADSPLDQHDGCGRQRGIREFIFRGDHDDAETSRIDLAFAPGAPG